MTDPNNPLQNGTDGGSGDPNDDRAFLLDLPPAEVDEQSQSEKPSQAEGQDPGRSPGGEALPEDGHPSQAEGEDPERGSAQQSTR